MPQMIEAITAWFRGSQMSGTAKLSAKMNLLKKVDTVAAQMCWLVAFGFASSAR